MSDTMIRTIITAISVTTAAVCSTLLASGAFDVLGNSIISSVAVGVGAFAGAFSPSLVRSATAKGQEGA